MSCEAARAAVGPFLADNSQCSNDEDCTQVSAFCVANATCGALAIAVGYDEAAWAAIDDGLGTCQGCSADPCGFPVVCNAANRCEFSPGG